MRRYKTRGGSVKVNWVLSELPRYEGVSDDDQARLIRSGVAFCPSIDYLERAWQDACRGMPSEAPYLEVECPSSIDSTLTDDGSFVVTMFTQYGPYDEAGWPEGSREAYADRCLEILASRAPNVRDAVVHCEVLAPPDLERIFGLVGGSIFQGEQGLDQMAFMRPTPALGAVRDAGRRPVPLRSRNASRRRGHGAGRPQRRPARSPRRALAPRAPAGARGAAGLTPQERARTFVEDVLIPLEEKAERAGGRLPDSDVARIRSAAVGGGPGGRSPRARARRPGLVEARVGAGRGAVRPLHQRPVVARAERLQRAGLGVRPPDRPLPANPLCAVSCTTPTRSPRPRAGSDPSGIETTAVRRDGGWVINGEKWFVTYGDVAAVYIVVAMTDDGPTLFLVDRSCEGISVVDDPPFTHSYPHGHPTIRFTDVRRGRRRGDRRRRRGRRAAARVVHRGADRDRGARRGRDVAAARGGDGLGAGARAGRVADHGLPGRVVPAWPTRPPTRPPAAR